MVDFARPTPAPTAELLERLLYAVSHDLRSPALTLSLSGERGEDAVLCFVPAIELPPFEDSPLAALCGSLTAYAGTALERAAALQLLFERHGAALHLEAAAAQLWLPLAQSAEGAPAAAAEDALAAAIERAP